MRGPEETMRKAWTQGIPGSVVVYEFSTMVLAEHQGHH